MAGGQVGGRPPTSICDGTAKLALFHLKQDLGCFGRRAGPIGAHAYRVVDAGADALQSRPEIAGGPGRFGRDAKPRRTFMKLEWHKPEVTEQEVGLEVTSYAPAELDRS
jgi:coenzyme PQQ precursor peptide PqqA